MSAMPNPAPVALPARAKPRLVWTRARNVGAVFAGVVLVLVLMIGMNLLLSRWTVPSNSWFQAGTLAGAAIIHFAGGFLCALISRGSRYATAGVVVVGSALMVMSVVQTWSGLPPWYSIAMLVIAPAGLLLGAAARSPRLPELRPSV